MTNKAIRFIILNLAFSFCFSANTYANDIDSLKNLLSQKIADSVRVKLLNELSKCYFSDKPDTVIVIADSSRRLAEAINYQPGLALALKNKGIGYYKTGKFVDAIKTWQQATDVYKKMGDEKGVANMLSNQGAIFFAQGDPARALELYLDALKIAEKIKDTVRIVTCLTNIGGVYQLKEDTYDKALDYFQRSYKLSFTTNDQYSIGVSAVNLGDTYFKMGNDSAALPYLFESVKVHEAAGETGDLPYPLNIIGRVYTRQKKFEQAIESHKKAFKISEQLDQRLDMTQSLTFLGQAYNASGEINQAIETFNKALEYALPLHAFDEMKYIYEGLALAYEKQQNFTSAFKYQGLLMGVRDSIYNAEINKKMAGYMFGYDLDKKQSEIKLLNKDKEIQRQEIQRQKLVKYTFIGGFGIMLLFAIVFFNQRNKISKGKKRSDELLLNILPEETAEELKHTGTAQTKSFDIVTVLFTDFKNFTIASEKLTPQELVAEINHCYSEFDRIVTKYGIEKIKTIGDSYMCAGGLPVTNHTHPEDVVSAGLEMVAFIEKNKQERIAKDQPYFELRCGIHSGPVVAGIVGIKKFAYDIWGDTVNTASRMESSGQVGKVNISGSTYEMIKDKFICTHRGKIEAKNKGMIDMYFVEAVNG